MFRPICIVTLLLFVQYCQAQPDCTKTDAAQICKAPLYKPGECPETKCLCADGYSPTEDVTTCKLKNPTIGDANAGKKYYTNVDYILECTTAANNVDFKWYKADAVQPDKTSKTYTIKERQEMAVTKYKCEITAKGTPASSATSDEVSVTIVAPGRVCDANEKCTGPEFSGTCDETSPRRCVCAANYVVKEDTCSKNGAAVVNTSLLVFVVAIFSQLVKLS